MIDDINHIDVISGAGSSVYGLGAGSMVIDIHTLNGDTSKGFSATLRGGGNYDFGSFSFQDSFDLPNDRSLYLYGAIGLIDGVSSDDFRSPICD